MPFAAGIDSLQAELGKQESMENNDEGAEDGEHMPPNERTGQWW